MLQLNGQIKIRLKGLQKKSKDADVFIGVSVANALSQDMVKSMADNPIIFAMANPNPEIIPDDAKAAGARVVGTGRSDYPNQINNVLAFLVFLEVHQRLKLHI